MSNDIRSILEKLANIEESRITPVGVKHGLNQQQKSVHQLPALFKPHGIKALGSKKDPTHPMSKELVGDSVEPKVSALEEAMQEVEEDMLSKVRRDLNNYLDRLGDKVSDDGRREKETPQLDKLDDKVSQYRDLITKAVDAVEQGKAEEEIEENDYEMTNPATQQDSLDHEDVALAQPQKPVSVMTMEDGAVFEVHQCGVDEYEVRHGGRSVPSRFKSPEEANMAIDLFRAHRNRKMQPQDLSQDYIEER